MRSLILQTIKSGEEYTLDEIVVSIVKTQLNDITLTTKSLKQYLKTKNTIYQILMDMHREGLINTNLRTSDEVKFSSGDKSV